MNNKNLKGRKKDIHENFSATKWTIFFTVIAITAIVAIGFKSNAFAAVTDYKTDTIPDSITTEVSEYPEIKAQANGIKLTIKNFVALSGADKYKVYCIEAGIPFAATSLTKDPAEYTSDIGLIYILNNVFPYTTNSDYLEEEEIWIGQTAIWYYLAQKYPEDSTHTILSLTGGTVDQMATAFRTATTKLSINDGVIEEGIPLPDRQGTVPISALWAKVENLVIDAQNATINNSSYLNLTDEITLTKSEDGNYMQTSMINVDRSSNFINYKINKQDFPEGTKVYDANGTEITDTENMTQTGFYLTIPTAAGTSTFNIIASGNFRLLNAFRYTAPGAQTVILTKEAPDSKGDELSITVNVPDTADNMPTSIIFIGLIILLSGAGIIYANIKPKEKK